MWIFALFLAVPLIEIGLFVTVGGWLGLWATLAIIFITGFAGVSVLRSHAGRLRGIRGSLRDPVVLIADGGLVLVAAILLILPGFLTDGLGILLLLPPLRRLIILLIGQRLRQSFGAQSGWKAGDRRDGEVIDGTWSEEEERAAPLPAPEQRTRH